MLLTFRVTNFRSMRDEQELSMARSGRLMARGPAGGSERDVNTIAAIYGPNASGKSNLLLALRFMSEAVVASHSRWSPDEGVPFTPFLLDERSRHETSRFEAEFVIDDVRMQYGFELDSERVRGEWLYSYPSTRRRTLFERQSRQDEDDWYFGKSLAGRNKVITEITRANSLFLSAATTAKHRQLSQVSAWFGSSLRYADSHNFEQRLAFTIKQVQGDEAANRKVTDLLRLADLGVCGLQVRETPLSDEEAARIERTIVAVMPDGPDKTPQAIEAVTRTLRAGRTTLELQHQCAGSAMPVTLPFNAESVGTRSLIGLAGPVLHVLEGGQTLMVDEIDTSLHPRLVAALVRLFASPQTNPHRAQVIFTSHDTSLLGNLTGEEPLLERDQVWFVEKDATGASTLYPLTDFSPRRVENLERGYLQGRYGAIPFLTEESLVREPEDKGNAS